MKATDEDRIIADLVAHPSWEALKIRFAEERERSFAKFAKQMMAGVQVSGSLIDEKRGFWRGGQWFIDEVERSAERLSRDVFTEEG